MKIHNAAINWLETGLPFSAKFGDVYYSRQDECAESQHVFLAANRLDAGNCCRPAPERSLSVS
ncbi:MAG: hypothetical protein IIC10_10670 [Proteobacteria bacterium]|nr:hypothetical protein [Pseudomonadota bacterium]